LINIDTPSGYYSNQIAIFLKKEKMSTIIKGLRRPTKSGEYDDKPSNKKDTEPESTNVEIVETNMPLVCLGSLIGTHVESISTEMHASIDSTISTLEDVGKLAIAGEKAVMNPTTIATLMTILKTVWDKVVPLYQKLPKNIGFRKYLDEAVSNLSHSVVSGKGGLASAAVGSLDDFTKFGHSLIDSNSKLTDEQKISMKGLMGSDPTIIFDKNGEFYQHFADVFKGKTFQGLSPEIFAAGASVATEGLLRIVRLVGTPIAGALGGLVTVEAGGIGSVAAAAAFRTAMTGIIAILPALVSHIGPSLFAKIKSISTKLLADISNPAKLVTLKKLFVKAPPKKTIMETNAVHEVERVESEPIPTDVESMTKLIDESTPMAANKTNVSKPLIRSLIGPPVSNALNEIIDDSVPYNEEQPVDEKEFTDEHIGNLRKHLRQTVPLNTRHFKTKVFYRSYLLRRLELQDQPLQQIMQEFVAGMSTLKHQRDREHLAHSALHKLTAYYLRHKDTSNREIMAYAVKNMATQILLQSHPFFQ
jgi:hypothetical protein